MQDSSSCEFEILAPEKVIAAIRKIDEAISDKQDVPKKIKQKAELCSKELAAESGMLC
jgi:hypothetical protein